MTWPPETEADLVAALEAGDVSESNRLDFKALVGDTPGARKDTAKDLASFAIDGGALLIGVREDKEARSFHPQPVVLRDAIERIEQIAGNRVEPPLVVRPREIPSTAEGLGYLWVEVPASPDAPHMVDGRYLGRGERTNRTLSDADVRRLHRARRDTDSDLRAALTALQAKDPIPGARPAAPANALPKPRFGHLYLVATPRRASPRIAEHLVWEQPQVVLQQVMSAAYAGPDDLRGWATLGAGVSIVPRQDAVALTNFRDDVDLEQQERGGSDLRVGTDASITYIRTDASDRSHEDRGQWRVLDGAVLTSVWHLLDVMRRISEAIEFDGSWDVGLRVTGLEGCWSMVVDTGDGIRGKGAAYDESQYERFIVVTHEDLGDPDPAVKALVQPLLRALNSWRRWTRMLPQLA